MALPRPRKVTYGFSTVGKKAQASSATGSGLAPRAGGKIPPDIASFLYARLNRDETNPHYRGAGIPVYFRASTALPVVLDLAYTTVVILIVSNKMIVEKEWRDYAGRLAREVAGSGGRHHLVPLALTANFGNLDLAGDPQAIRLEKLAGEERQWQLEERLFEYLCRLLRSSLKRKGPWAAATTPGGQPSPVVLFLSHAKKDGGDDLIRRIRDELDKTPLKTFYDARDITAGSDWQKALVENAGNDVLLALVTDPYATRDWCRREILSAKEAGCPIVAVVSLEKGEARSFPYAGNVPTVPWTIGADTATQTKTIHLMLRVTLRELLRHTHFLRQCETLQEQGFLTPECIGFGSPPELITFHFQQRALSKKSGGPYLIIYPDPPLSLKERELFADLDSNIRIATPMTAGGHGKGNAESPLTEKEIALSVGDVPDKDLLRAGLSRQHLDDAVIEISRHLLARGATLAYGGAPQSTFTENLLDLVQTHLHEGELRFNRLHNYVAEPYLPKDPDDFLGKRIKVVELHSVPPPGDVRGLPFKSGPATSELEARYVKARHLTEMRRTMTDRKEIIARVALGGKLDKFSGRYPGIAEEVLMFLGKNKPVFVLGGFGGCAAAVAACLMGRPDERLSGVLQNGNPENAGFQTYYNQRRADAGLGADYAIDYAGMQKTFQKCGAAGLNNGLTAGENAVLFQSQDMTEIIYYLLKGLANLPGS